MQRTISETVFTFFLLCCLHFTLQQQQQQEGSNTVEPVPSPRILGGTPARQGQYPFQISLRLRDRHICSGSILNPEWIITAAHCARGKPAWLLSIQAGSLRLDSGGVVHSVREVKLHPHYLKRWSRDGFDVAILRLHTNLTFSENITSIPISDADPEVGSTVQISGWGTVFSYGPLSNELLTLNVTLMARAQCVKYHYIRLSLTQMCLMHQLNVGACHGDSGGPAVYNGTLVGVAVWVLGGCGFAEPDGYERAWVARQWIESELRESYYRSLREPEIPNY